MCVYADIYIYIYMYMYVYIYIYIYIYMARCGHRVLRSARDLHACHIIPPSEIGRGLFWAVFIGSEGKSLFHRIG